MYDALYNKAGATGLFTDFPDLGVQFLENQKKYFLLLICGCFFKRGDCNVLCERQTSTEHQSS